MRGTSRRLAGALRDHDRLMEAGLGRGQPAHVDETGASGRACQLRGWKRAVPGGVVSDAPTGVLLSQDEKTHGVERAARGVPFVKTHEDSPWRAWHVDRRCGRRSFAEGPVVVAGADDQQAAGAQLAGHLRDREIDLNVIKETWDGVVAGDDGVEFPGDVGEIAEVRGLSPQRRVERPGGLRGSAQGALGDIRTGDRVATQRQTDGLGSDSTRTVEDRSRVV